MINFCNSKEEFLQLLLSNAQSVISITSTDFSNSRIRHFFAWLVVGCS